MAIYINQNRKISNIYANVNGEKKSISSAWVNRDGIPTKVFQLDNHKQEIDPYEVAPANAHNNWNYTLNDDSNIITLNYYTGSEVDVIVYGNYVINGKTYKTQIASNIDNSTMNTKYMFNATTGQINCANIKSIKFNRNIDTSNVTNMNYMFSNCNALTILNISNFDTSNVTNMSGMFYACNSLTSLDLSNFDTSNVTNMNLMFGNCITLTALNISNFDTSNVENMSNMFYACNSFISLDLSNFDTSNVTNMSGMFSRSISLTSLNLSSFNTNNVTNMSGIFSYCSNLTEVLVSRDKWILKSGCNKSYMFTGCGCGTVTYVD